MCIQECDTASMHKRSKRPNGLLVKTDSVSLGSSGATPAPGWLSATPRSMSARVWTGATGFLATPRNCLNSARRVLYTAPWEEDGSEKVWLRLELRLGLETLVAGAGNGRLGLLRLSLRREFAEVLDLELSQVCDSACVKLTKAWDRGRGLKVLRLASITDTSSFAVFNVHSLRHACRIT